jgi:flagellar biosynthesis/type III secretory pathway protein FliH
MKTAKELRVEAYATIQASPVLYNMWQEADLSKRDDMILTIIHEEAFSDGYSAGYDQGYTVGSHEGYGSGYGEGYAQNSC